MDEPMQVYSVSDFQAVCNQIMETAFSGVVVEGEVASFKVNQGKFVFFDLKDEQSSATFSARRWHEDSRARSAKADELG